MEEEMNYAGQAFGETNLKLRDLEEKQRILKDRLLLIGQNLLEIKERRGGGEKPQPRADFTLL